MNLYISSPGIVSGAGNNKDEQFLSVAPVYDTNRLPAVEPDYIGEIPPMQLRRMSKAVRMGVAASKMALKRAGIEKPDAISVGTALGCLQDTETFLQKMVEQDEQMLTPTAFIQSTHNTVAGQVALLAGCTGHNLTYTHRGHSFEHALINAALYLEDHIGEKLLVGGIDELTETSFSIFRRAKVYRQDNATPDSILNDAAEGSIAGEGAAFFLAGDKPFNAPGLHIKDLFLFTTRDSAEVLEKINGFVQRNNISGATTDIALLGINGDIRTQNLYTELQQTAFKNIPVAAFKHLCGEYGTASSFALGLLLHAVQKQLPQAMMVKGIPGQINQIALINHYLHYYSCWLICVE